MSSPEEIVMNSRNMDASMYIAHDPCEFSGHRYHATWEDSHVLCIRCGKKAVYPVCVPQWPDTKLAFWLCPKHHPKEETS